MRIETHKTVTHDEHSNTIYATYRFYEYHDQRHLRPLSLLQRLIRYIIGVSGPTSVVPLDGHQGTH